MTLYRQELQRYLTEDLGFKPENVVIQDGKGDQAEQTNQINNFITQKYDVLILNLVQASSAPEITDMCKKQEFLLFTSTVSQMRQKSRDGLTKRSTLLM